MTVLQVVGKSYDSVSGRLKGLSMSDGCIVSHNVVPNNHAAAEQMNEFKRFDLIQVKAARVKKDLLILDDVDLFEVTDKAHNPFQITYDSFSDVGEIRVYWRADFQSGSRVLKKVF